MIFTKAILAVLKLDWMILSGWIFVFLGILDLQILKHILDHFKHIIHDFTIYHVLIKTAFIVLVMSFMIILWVWQLSGDIKWEYDCTILEILHQSFAVVTPGCSRFFHGFPVTPHLYVSSLKPFFIIQQYGERLLLLYQLCIMPLLVNWSSIIRRVGS